MYLRPYLSFLITFCPSGRAVPLPDADSSSSFWRSVPLGFALYLYFFSFLPTPSHQCLNKHFEKGIFFLKKKKPSLDPTFLSSHYSDVHLPTWMNSLKGFSTGAVSICSFPSASQFTVLFLQSFPCH